MIKKHGLSKHQFYQCWVNIRGRCYNKKNRSYKNYGARGITMFEDWIDSPVEFIKYIEQLPGARTRDLSIDRKNNDVGYKPGNLQWSTPHFQTVNSRKNCKNKSGYVGIFYRPDKGKWSAVITVYGDRISLGNHLFIKDAINARNQYILCNDLLEYPIQRFKHQNK